MRWQEITEAHRPVFNDKTIVYDPPSIAGVKMFSAGYHPDVGIGWIEAVQVDPSSRGQGIGQQAVEAFERWVKHQGGREIRGEALASSLVFWKKLGYRHGKQNHSHRSPITKSL